MRNDFTLFFRVVPSGKKVVYYYAYDENGTRKVPWTTGLTNKTAARNRPYKSSKKFKNMQLTTEIEIAYGTKLFYWLIDTGHIFVALYPAYTEKHKTQEEFIISN